MKKWRTEAKRPRKICGLAERLSPVNRGLFPAKPVVVAVLILTSLPAGRSRAKPEAFTRSLVDLFAVAPFVRRQRHHSIMDLGINSQHAIDRLFRPFPPEVEGVLVVVHENDSFTLSIAGCLRFFTLIQ